MIALGIDPGTRRLGWGVVQFQNSRIRHVAHGVISVPESLTLAKRLSEIDRELSDVLDRYRPAVGSVETLFFHKDAQAAAKLGHARGVVLLRLARANVDIAEYPPAQVKRIITGKGQADKKQVALMIQAILALDETPPSDAADALALAITHLRRAPLEAALAERLASADPASRAIARWLQRGKYRPKRGRSTLKPRPARTGP